MHFTSKTYWPGSPDGSWPGLLWRSLFGAVAVAIALLSVQAAPTTAHVGELPPPAPAVTVSDTDSVVAPQPPPSPDSTELRSGVPTSIDTSGQADTLQYRATPRADRYLPERRSRTAPSLVPRPRPFRSAQPSSYRHEATLDSTGSMYTIREQVGSLDMRAPFTVDRTTYRQAKQQTALRANWQEVAEERARERQRSERGGVGVSVDIPGGQQSTFSTVFGRPEVDLRMTGQADLNAGFDYRKSDQQASISGRASSVDPDFQQDLRLGITGTIGDKLQVDVDWDTQSDFDYQNQVKLEYTGYEDEILQKVEAGNVFLETPSSLIRGGQSLFGIKSELQFGDLTLTTVASQQEGQSNSLSIEGGAEAHTFSLRPTDYDESAHFFLGYYFRNRWDEALSDLPTIQRADGFERITDIEVWKLQTSANVEERDVRQVAAVVDLGEEPVIVDSANAYTRTVLPSSENDRYTEADLDDLRDPNTPLGEAASTYGLSSSDYQTGKFRRLARGQDYEFDEQLGYLSLKQRLQDNEALAISFRYRAGGQTYQVGDFTEAGGTSGGANADRLALKLLRPAQLRQPSSGEDGYNPAAWHLEMRNIYPLRGRDFDPDNFRLNVQYAPPGSTPRQTLPGLSGQESLLQIFGLDRLNDVQAPQPDDRFDFLSGLTIDPQEGLLIFPYVEPFGAHLQSVIEEKASPDEQQALIDDLVFSSLYRLKKQNAREESQQFDIYQIEGEYRGTTQDFYDLRAPAGVVDGSVQVTSGGTPLQEGVDFEVDYQGGSVRILNDAFLSAGRGLQIDYEQNALFNLQKKTLLGARANYSYGDKLSLGGTLMRLSEKAPVDKFRIGEEPISNTIWGVDAALDLEPRWLTRAVDALPFLQTRASSSLSLSGEFAQFLPGHTETNAFDRTRSDLQDDGKDFRSDELGGISYLDDFESFENTFSLASQPQNWQLSAAPYKERLGPSQHRPMERRAALAWYQLNAGVREDLKNRISNPGDPASKLVQTNEVFPNRDTRGEIDNSLATLDFYFDPRQRGPYNYNEELNQFLNVPKENWGGMTQRLPEGYSDFSVNNVEFVEFIFKPHVENTANDAGEDAVLYVDLGAISEDIIPDGKLNTEDGLSASSFDTTDFSAMARLPDGLQDGSINIENGRTEDLGLDGLVSYDTEAYPEIVREQFHFRDFLNALESSLPPPGLETRHAAEAAKARLDPSGDDYQHYENDAYFGDEELFPGGAKLQERFLHYQTGHELNAYESQNRLAQNTSITRGNTREPDTEDLNFNATVDIENSYFQYKVPLSRKKLEEQAEPTATNAANYVVGEIEDQNGNGTGWYQVRIPVRSPARDTVGTIRDFSLIESIRVWTEGHEVPVTLRFATLELVGSQWRKSTRIPSVADENAPLLQDDSRLTISSVNNEKNAGIYEPPDRAIIGQQRQARGALQDQREQSLALEVEDLRTNQQRAVFKAFNQGSDLLKYSNLRMFVHLHGSDGDGLLTRGERGKAKLFVRLGASETGDYYEYEQPLTPTALRSGLPADSLWLRENEMNLRLSALNQLKVARDQSSEAQTDSIFWSVDRSGALRPGAPDAEEFAPPGTRLGVKGTPSLQNINTIVIGVRNATGEKETMGEALDVTLWTNELRATGYDEESGWAAQASADIELADLARIKASFQKQTDGFGSLASTLGERQLNDMLDWSVRAEFYADRLLPENHGWQIPVSMQLQSRTSTPRFAPNRGDVRINEIIDQIEANDEISEKVKERRKKEAIHEAQDYRYNHSITASIQRQGDSGSPLSRYTVDALSLDYSYSTTDARSPSRQLNNNWRWHSSLQYRLGFDEPHTVRPLWFLSSLPLLNGLGDLQFNYAPQSVGFSSSAERRFDQQQGRPRELALGIPLPERLRAQQDFDHDRQFNLQHRPFDFFSFSFDTNTNQTFNTISADTLYSVITRNEGGSVEVIQQDGQGNPLRADSANALASRMGNGAFRQDQLQLNPTGDVLSDLFGGSTPRTERYRQRFSGTLRLPFAERESLDWLDFEDVSYQSLFSWQNGPMGRNTGASVNNQSTVRSGVTLHPQELWRKFGFYRRIEEQQQNASEDEQLPGAAADTTATEDDEDGGSFLADLLPSPTGLLRQLFLTVTGVRDLQVTYSTSREARSTGVARDGGGTVNYSLLDAMQGDGASLGYRFGLARQISDDNRFFGSSVQVRDVLSDNNELRARTTLSPGQHLRVNLNWDLNWSRSQNITYNTEGKADSETESGSNQSSAWAFGASYLDLFERQLETLRGDLGANTDPGTTTDPDQNGRIALTNASIRDDFRGAFLRGGGPIDGLGLLPFPMPSWDVRYTGLAGWPLVDALTQSATLQHAYSASYSSNYRSNDARQDTAFFSLGPQRIQYLRSAYTTGDLRVDERYQPFLGVDISWEGGLQTSIAWNRQNNYFLSTSNAEVTEQQTNELTLTANYQKQGLDIPFLPIGRLNNRITFSLSVSRSANQERRLNLRNALAEAASSGPDEFDSRQALEGDNANTISETARLSVTPKLGYQFSNQVSADFVLEFESFDGDNRRPSYTNVTGGFNVRVSISN